MELELNHIIGDATYETANWWNDEYGFVNNYNSFFIRGGYSDMNISAGIFNFNRTNGDIGEVTCRLCLTL